MQAADDVKLGDRFRVAGGRRLKGLFQRHGVGAGRIFLASERAQAAGGDADVRRIDVAVDVEVRGVAVHPLAHPVGQPADGENVAGAVKGESVGLVQALSGQDFVLDRMETGVVGLKWMRAGHRLL